MQDKSIADFHGVSIEVEASSTFLGGAFRLIIANEKQDELKGSLGEHTLRGKLTHEGKTLPVQVVVKMGLFGTKYRLLVDGREHPIQRLK